MTGPARIRPARREDMPPLWELVRALARYERLESRLTGDAAALGRHLFDDRIVRARVAERDGALVGYTLTFTTYSSFRTAPKLWLEDLFVLPSERGAGTGRALLAAVAAEALALGCASVSWEVLDWNSPAIGFYEANGAERDGGGWFTYHLDAGTMRRLAGGPSA
jgi:GNAT superfamily N-acetyltransferase